MKINAIELYHVSVPLKETFWPTWIPGYPQTHNRFTLIKIVTDEGIEGYSAGSAMGKERAGLGDLLRSRGDEGPQQQAPTTGQKAGSLIRPISGPVP